MAPNRRNALAIVAIVGFAAVVTVVGLLGAGTITIGGLSATTTSRPVVTDPLERYLAVESRALRAAAGALDVTLPARSGKPAPAWPASPWRAPLPTHTVVGFVPWYELSAAGSLGSAPPSDFSQLVYYALPLRRDGSLDESLTPDNGGYDDLENGGASALVARAHAGGAQALLGLATTTQSTVDSLTSDPVANGRRMAAGTIPLLAKYGFDGVDLDIEGESAADRGGFVQLVDTFSSALRAADPSWTVMLNTYPNSADDPSSFFDPKALAPAVSDFFVMAYDMNDFEVPSATAPLEGIDVSDAVTLATYAAAGLAGKTILGVPFYGYDFAASAAKPGAVAVGPPVAVAYASIVKVGRPAIWDPVSETPYSVFRRAGSWHQTWFDDPVSIALKAALASQFHAAGVGAWELGMVAGEQEMVEAMLGGSPPRRLPLARPPSGAPSP